MTAFDRDETQLALSQNRRPLPPSLVDQQAIVDMGTGRRLQVRRYAAAAVEVEMSSERAQHLPPSPKARWVYDPTTALLLFPAACLALATDAEGRWEAALALVTPALWDNGGGDEATVAAEAQRRVSGHVL